MLALNPIKLSRNANQSELYQSETQKHEMRGVS